MRQARHGAASWLVTAIVTAVTLAIVLPLVGQTRDQAAQTQCRANLQKIGQALALYAADYGNHAPAIGGNFYLQGDKNNHSDGGWALPWRNPGSDPANPPGHFGSFSAVAPSSTQMVVGQPQPWLCTDTAPARAIGLGLLWTGGYIGKTPAVLYCPGLVAPANIITTDAPKNHQFDADEPFWTSNGKVIRGDDDGIGNPGKPNAITGSDWYSCTSDGAPSGKLPPGACSIWSNYSWRVDEAQLILNANPTAFQRAHPLASSLEGAARKGLYTDMIDHWIAARGPFVENEDIQPPKYEYPPAPERYELARKRFVANHNMAYNVLFGDGSVKTFVDMAGELYMALVDWRGASSTRSGWTTTHYVTGSAKPKSCGSVIWQPFLDTATEAE